MAEDLASVNLVVSGRVQGVGFRYFTSNHAKALGLSGWVRNMASGSVEIEVGSGSVGVSLLECLEIGVDNL